ncbi:TLC domain-containing protein 5 [Ricinus communis]|uniref:TLC domain-containing protein n=1 Tax=Ricinus communis TaxID=3988 RepID=B9R7Z6_RICCO|nr:TLC domain-containing protein 5 [Ricinus communis]EEF52626.1 conserved hypothetical protein [Ricinus communis]|eukprot:XP_002510439.1 transmembrane protein 136 [Ricinus communis]
MEKYILNIIILGVISWGTIFLLIRKVVPSRSFEFCNRLVSTIHAIVAVTLASISVEDWRCPVRPLASECTPSQMIALAVTVSYLIYDLLCCLFDTRPNLDNTIHHLVSIVGLGAGLVYHKSGTELVAALWITEISSPFLHLRELLKELGYRNTNLNLAADISFAVVFSVGRMVVGPYLAYATLTANNPIIIQAMAVGLQMVSAFWFYKIVRMVKYKLATRTTSKKVVSPEKLN